MIKVLLDTLGGVILGIALIAAVVIWTYRDVWR